MESFNRRNDIMSFMFLQGLSVSFVEKGLEGSRGEQGAAGSRREGGAPGSADRTAYGSHVGEKEGHHSRP